MDLKKLMISMHDPNWEFYVPKQQLENVPLKGSKVGLQRFNGHLLPQLCRNLTVIKNMDVRPDDTFVVTFPKSGTNWVAEMCWLINNNCDFDAANKKHHMARSSFIDMGWSNGFLNLMPSPRVFQSHLRLEFLPDNVQNKAKLVYVVRNPKDVLVSLYFFSQKLPEDSFDGTLEDMYEGFLEGKVMYGAWWDHINEYAQLNNIHIIHFEDLLEDSINETRKLAKFLGKDLSDEKLKSVVDFCSFDNLSKSPAFDMKMGDNSAQGPNEPGKKVAEVKLFRKGQIGDWKNHLNDDLWKKLDETVAKNLKYKKPFRDEPTVGK